VSRRLFQNTGVIGILGGSFDPIHNGHLYLADQARAALSLDKVVLIPALRPPHKTSRTLTDSIHRLRMIELALQGRDWLITDRREIERGGISYTVDTVKALSAAYPDSKLYFIIGSDSLLELSSWRSIDEIARRVTFVTLSREHEHEITRLKLPDPRLADIPIQSTILPAAPLEVSSTQVRRYIAAGKSILHLVPEAVALYIERNRLYGRDSHRGCP